MEGLYYTYVGYFHGLKYVPVSRRYSLPFLNLTETFQLKLTSHQIRYIVLGKMRSVGIELNG